MPALVRSASGECDLFGSTVYVESVRWKSWLRQCVPTCYYMSVVYHLYLLSKFWKVDDTLTQNITANVQRVTPIRTHQNNIAELLAQLHWLPIEWSIRFKLATLTYAATVAHHNLPTFCSITSPQSQCVHRRSLLSYFRFRDTVYLLARCLPCLRT